MRIASIVAALLALPGCHLLGQQAFDPRRVETITGAITRADHQTYREVPFTVPKGATMVAIDFSYGGRDQRTVIDIGVRDPHGLRGWSGGNKNSIQIAEDVATPSYRPGPLPPGEWKVILGIPNIREGQSADYAMTIRFDNSPRMAAPRASLDPAKPLVAGPGWYRGDFHAHTAHSDGACDVDGKRQPCPAIRTFEAARDAGLDFVAATDHNTITQLADIAVAQASFPTTLLIPGTEITTFHGHANVIGNTDMLDFQLGSPRLPTLDKLLEQVAAQGAILSINHPALPSGEACMGCGWTVKDTDWSRVAAIEIVNGATLRTAGPEAAFSGIPFWQTRLKEGHRITAIGGSDNHDADDRAGGRQSPVGRPTTVVYATELSTKGIIDGVRSGRVFVDVAGLPDAALDLNGATMNQAVAMGGELILAAGDGATITATGDGLPPGARIEMVAHGLVARPAGETAGSISQIVHLEDDAPRGWIRANVRDADGKLLLIGNPIYIRR